MKRGIGILLVSLALVCVLVLSATAASAAWRVRVKGGGRALVTWGNIGSTNQATVTLPWAHKVGVDGGWDVVSVVAQRNSGGPGRIICQVIHNGQVVTRGRGSGPYAVCSASESTSTVRSGHGPI